MMFLYYNYHKIITILVFYKVNYNTVNANNLISDYFQLYIIYDQIL